MGEQPQVDLMDADVGSSISTSGTSSKRRCFEESRVNRGKQPIAVVYERHGKGAKQVSAQRSTKSKEEIERFHRQVADFFYENGILINAASSRSFELMIEACAQVGPGVKPPSCDELRGPLLVTAVDEINRLKDRHMVAWRKYGCSLMLDGWSDGKKRHLVNILVNSPEGTFFLKSVDASSEVQDGKLLAEIIEKIILQIGKENVVQVVSDNGSTFKKVGEVLQQKFPSLYWTPCATHCLNLMLADIGNFPEFKDIIQRARQVTLFMYKDPTLHALMWEKIGEKELVRPGSTCITTAFLTLQSMYKYKDVLRRLFVSDYWCNSKLSKTNAGKNICDIVLSSSFWSLMEDCIRASLPFLVVMRIADVDEQPAMPEIAMAMYCAKEEIRKSFASKPRLLQDLLNIIEGRWYQQMGVELYGAALFLNPLKFFEIGEKDHAYARWQRAMFNDVLEKMIVDEDLQTKICHQVDDYDRMRGTFSKPPAIEQRKTKSPTEWWNDFVNHHAELHSLAFRILSLCSSSFGCEHDWSTFQSFHSKRRTKLEQKRLEDLLYVQYNLKLANRFQKRREEGNSLNPLLFEEFQWDNEWVTKMPIGGRVVHSEDQLFDGNLQDAGASGSGSSRLENEESCLFPADDMDSDSEEEEDTSNHEKGAVLEIFDDI